MKEDTWHITARGCRVVELKSLVPESTLFQRGELAEYIEHLESTAYLRGQECMRERAAQACEPGPIGSIDGGLWEDALDQSKEHCQRMIRTLEPEPLER